MKRRIEVRHTGASAQRVPDEAIQAARDFIRVAVGLHKAAAVTRLHPHYDDHASRFAVALQLLTQTYFADVLREDEDAPVTCATIPSAFGSALALATCTLLGIPLGLPALIAAMGGLGKSYLALDLALQIAAGVAGLEQPRKTLGGRIAVEGTAVVVTAGQAARRLGVRRRDSILSIGGNEMNRATQMLRATGPPGAR